MIFYKNMEKTMDMILIMTITSALLIGLYPIAIIIIFLKYYIGSNIKIMGKTLRQKLEKNKKILEESENNYTNQYVTI